MVWREEKSRQNIIQVTTGFHFPVHTQLHQFTQVVSMKLMELLVEDIAVCKTGAIEHNSVFSKGRTILLHKFRNKWGRLIFSCHQLTYYKACCKTDFISFFAFGKYSLVIF